MADNKETESTSNVEQKVETIKAENLNNNVNAVNRVDLSAIIPQDSIKGSEADSTLQSKENTLKGDGAVVIGNIENDVIQMTDATFPQAIDVEQRKKEQLEQLKAKKSNSNKGIRTASQEQKKAQAITSLIALVVIGILGGAYYYIKNMKTDKDFVVKNLTIELGDQIPVSSKDYVTPGIGSVVDDLSYSINTSEVIIDEVGEYTFYVTHNSITKNGTISIVDTTPPKVVPREAHIIFGQDYNPRSFVDKCLDQSGCEIVFENEEQANITEIGTHENISLIAKDPYENETKISGTLIIDSNYKTIKFNKEIPIGTNGNNYSEYQEYILYFSDYNSNNVLQYAEFINRFTYESPESYLAEKEKYKEDQEYTFSDEDNVITRKTKLQSVGTAPSDEIGIINYLNNLGFLRVNE